MDQLVNIPINDVYKNTKYLRIGTYPQILRNIENSCKNDNLLARYPLVVRKKSGNGYEIIDGHIRYQAAINLNLSEIQCFVTGMDDFEAILAMAKSNNAQKLTKLEIGLYALCFEKSVGGRGKRSGRSIFAESIGEQLSNIQKYINAAIVFNHIRNNFNIDEQLYLANKWTKICLIKQCPTRFFAPLVKLICEKVEPNKFDKCINLAKQIATIDNYERWMDTFFPEEKMIEMCAKNSTGINSIKNVFNKLNEITDSIIFRNNKQKAAELNEWLQNNAFASDDQNRTRFKFRDILAHLNQINGQNNSNSTFANFINGDCLSHIDNLKDNSVSLCLTDPPWGVNYNSISSSERANIINDTRQHATHLIQQMAKKLCSKMKQNSYVFVFCGKTTFVEFVNSFIKEGFTMVDLGNWKKNNHGQGNLYSGLQRYCETILVFTKGNPTMYLTLKDFLEYDIPTNRIHPTEKPVELLKEIINATTVRGDLVIDPFAGSASTLIAARELGRNWWGCELDENHYESAFNRLYETNRNEVAA